MTRVVYMNHDDEPDPVRHVLSPDALTHPLEVVEWPGQPADDDSHASAARPEGSPDSWCDRGRHFVPAGDTVPYERGSIYRLCSACIAASAEAVRTWDDLKAQGLDETELRAASGDR